MVSTVVLSFDSLKIELSGPPMAYDITSTKATAGFMKGVSYGNENMGIYELKSTNIASMIPEDTLTGRSGS